MIERIGRDSERSDGLLSRPNGYNSTPRRDGRVDDGGGLENRTTSVIKPRGVSFNR